MNNIEQLTAENAEYKAKIEELERQISELTVGKKGKKKERKVSNAESACRVITEDEYHEIIETLQTGYCGMRPNPRIAAALTVETNTGLRISDVLKLRLCDIVKDGNRYRLNITETKTGKPRRFTVNSRVYDYLVRYCYENGIKQDEVIFNLTERAVHYQLRKTVEWLGLEGVVSTHSFRKFFATRIYNNSNYNLALVQELLQHSSPAITRRYIGIGTQEVEEALENGTIL